MSQTRKDRGWKAIKARAEKLSRQLRVGVVGEAAAKDHGGIPTGELALVHELGRQDGTIAPRPFMRQTYDRIRLARQSKLEALARAILLGEKTEAAALAELGAWEANQTKNTILMGHFEPLEEETIARKKGWGGSRPLINFGDLLAAIGYEVK